MFDADTPPMEGLPVVVDGRRPDPAAVDEIAINETLAGILDVAVGDELDLTFASPDELGATAEPGESFTGPRRRARVVGIERSFVDLLGVVSTARAIDAARVSAGPAPRRIGREAASFRGMAVGARDGDLAAAQAAIDEAFAGRLYQVTPLVDADDRDPIVDAIRYEAGGTMVFGAITALAAAAFAGQAVSRQSRREWADGSTLRAIGMSDRDAGLAALLRGAVDRCDCRVVAIAAAIGLSALGPFGVAGQAEIDPGMVDRRTGPRRRRGGDRRRGHGGDVVAGGAPVPPVPPPAVVGPARRARGGAVAPACAGDGRGEHERQWSRALAGCRRGRRWGASRLAVGTALTAIGLTASLDALAGSPEQFGAPWDLSASSCDREPRRAARRSPS